MNNAFYLEESNEESSQDTSSEQARLTKIIEALVFLLKTEEWKTLEALHFKQEEERIERLLMIEAKKVPLDETKLYNLQGELKWAKRYADFELFAKVLKKQLDNLK